MPTATAPIARGSSAPSRPEANARRQTGGFSKPANGKPKPEPKIIHQTFFKSVGPRTYASQVKELANGNHMLLLTEGRRDEVSGEVRKTRLAVFSEDFPAFFQMVKQTAEFIKAHPVPPDVQARRKKFWYKQSAGNKVPVPAGGGKA
jgi:hypothetical protein